MVILPVTPELHQHASICKRSSSSGLVEQRLGRFWQDLQCPFRFQDSARQDTQQAKRPHADDPTGVGRPFLPAPEGVAVGPAHLMRQHGNPLQTAGAPLAADAARQAVNQSTIASWPRSAGQVPAPSAAVLREPQQSAAAAAQPRSSSSHGVAPSEHAAAAPAPRRTLASLAKEGRQAALREHSSSAAGGPTASVPAAPQPAVRADPAGGPRNSADGAKQDGVPAKRPPEEDVAVFIQRLRAELPPAACTAVLGHLAAYRCKLVDCP